MSCCCTNTLDFCKQDICSSGIDFDILAQKTGIHKLVVDYLGITETISASITEGDHIIFPVDSLSETYQYTAEMYDPDGVKIIIRKDDIDYDCFKFTTSVNIALNEVAEESGE